MHVSARTREEDSSGMLTFTRILIGWNVAICRSQNGETVTEARRVDVI